MCKFRDLKASEVEVRIGQVSDKGTGLALLLYKDARVDMAILDETVGILNWQREHYECKGNLFCRVGINRNYDKPDVSPDWVWKSDCGTESNTEAEKGEASDSFKRGCTNLGIGRELYTAPFIWVDKDHCKLDPKQNGKGFTCYDKFSVTEIVIENKVIVGLVIRNDTQRYICFSWGKVSGVKPKAPKAPKEEPKEEPKQEPKAEPEIGEISAEELKARREWASAFKLTDGEHRGFTLIYLRKNNKQAYAELRANPPSDEIATVIQIIDEWVASTQAS